MLVIRTLCNLVVTIIISFVGYQYALLSIKTALASIVRSYKVVGEKESTSVPHIRVKLDVMMKAIDGYEIALEKREIMNEEWN